MGNNIVIPMGNGTVPKDRPAPKGSAITRTWSSLSEFTEWCDNVPVNREGACGSAGSSTASSPRRDEFTLTKSWEEAVTLAHSGTWSEPIATVSEVVSGVKAKLGEAVRKRVPEKRNSMVGGQTNVGRFVAGHPDCMRRVAVKPGKGRSPVVRMIFNMSVSAGIDTPDMIIRGAAITALVEIVQRAGWQVQVIAGSGLSYNYDRKANVEYLVTVKEAGTYMAPADLMFAIAHPSMFRRLIFGAMEREATEIQHKFGFCYGYPGKLSDETKSEFAEVVVDASMLYGKDKTDDVIGWVLRQVEGMQLI